MNKKDLKDLLEWPCQQLLGGAGFAIYENVKGLCTHAECHPKNDERHLTSGSTATSLPAGANVAAKSKSTGANDGPENNPAGA